MAVALELELELIVVVLVSSALARNGDDVHVVVDSRSADAMANVCCCKNSLRFGDLVGAGDDWADVSSSACASRLVVFANDGDGTRLL